MPCDDPWSPEHPGADRQVGRAARGDGRALAGRNPAPAAAVALPAPSHHAASRQHKHRRESWPGAGPTVPGASSEPGAPGERHRTRCACGRQPSRARSCSPAERVVEREVCPDPLRPPCRGPCPPGPVRSSPGKPRGAPSRGWRALCLLPTPTLPVICPRPQGRMAQCSSPRIKSFFNLSNYAEEPADRKGESFDSIMWELA